MKITPAERTVAHSLVRFPDWLESQSGERTPQELGKKTLEPHNSKIFMGDHQKLMLIGKLHSWRSYWCWCHSLTFVGCPARSGFRSVRVCNLGRAVMFSRICSVSSHVFATRSTFIFLAFNISTFPHQGSYYSVGFVKFREGHTP